MGAERRSEIHGATTWLDKSLERAPGSLDISGGEGNDACCLARLQIFADLRDDLRLTGLARYISALPRPHLAGYAEADLTLQWDVRAVSSCRWSGRTCCTTATPSSRAGSRSSKPTSAASFSRSHSGGDRSLPVSRERLKR